MENYEISKSLRKLEIHCGFKLLPNALKYIRDSFPNIRKIFFWNLSVECICSDVKKVCFVCNKEFLKVCTKAFERSPFRVSMTYANCKPCNNLIITSIFEEYLVSRNSYRFVIRIKKYVKVRNYLLDIGISLAHKRPDIEINFKVDSNLSEGILCYKDLMPTKVKLDIVDKYYKNSEKSNEFIVYLNPLHLNLGGNHRDMSVCFGRIDPIFKYLTHILLLK